MVYISRKVVFSASHRHINPNLTHEENLALFGKDYSLFGHGHTYVCEATVKGSIDPKTGMVINLTEVDRVLQRIAVAEFDYRYINLEHPIFEHERINPTTENLVRYLWTTIAPELIDEPCELHAIRLEESPTLHVEYYGGADQMVYLTRVYEFSSAHRLYSPSLSDEGNRKIFGKCSNPNGHGHNYRLEVTVKGQVDPKTGMIVDLNDLDQLVEETVLSRFDHKHLNLDTVEFKNLNPTSENLAVVIWQILEREMGQIALHRIRLYETNKNCFEYYGEESNGQG